MDLNKNDGNFNPSIKGIESGKTSQVDGMNGILQEFINNDNYLNDNMNEKVSKSGDVMSGNLSTNGLETKSLELKNTDNPFIDFTSTAYGDIDYGHRLIARPNGKFEYMNAITGASGELYHTGFKPSKTDVGLSNVPNYSATSSVADPSNEKLATAGAVKQANDNAESRLSKKGGDIYPDGVLGNTAGSVKSLLTVGGDVGNRTYFDFYQYRNVNGGDWESAKNRIGYRVDSIKGPFVEFNHDSIIIGGDFKADFSNKQWLKATESALYVGESNFRVYDQSFKPTPGEIGAVSVKEKYKISQKDLKDIPITNLNDLITPGFYVCHDNRESVINFPPQIGNLSGESFSLQVLSSRGTDSTAYPIQIFDAGTRTFRRFKGVSGWDVWTELMGIANGLVFQVATATTIDFKAYSGTLFSVSGSIECYSTYGQPRVIGFSLVLDKKVNTSYSIPMIHIKDFWESYSIIVNNNVLSMSGSGGLLKNVVITKIY